MTRKHKHIYRIARYYRLCEVWTGSATDHDLIGRSTVTPDRGLNIRQREKVIKNWLWKQFRIRVKG